VPGISVPWRRRRREDFSLTAASLPTSSTTFSDPLTPAFAAFSHSGSTVVIYMPGPQYNEVSQWFDAGFRQTCLARSFPKLHSAPVCSQQLWPA
jgi:hypothetical protein